MNNALSTVYSSKNVGQSTYSRLHETKPELLSEENYQALIATEVQDEADAVKEKEEAEEVVQGQ